VTEALPFVSVIVPVYNDPEGIAACVAGLQRQTYPHDRYEIVVVDNGSSPPVALPPAANLRVELDLTPGSFHARNTGIAVAKGEVLAFIDADCAPMPAWIERGVAALAALGTGAIGGAVQVNLPGPPRTAVEAYESLYPYRQDLFIEWLRFSQTANLFTQRETMDRVGHFDTEAKSGGDAEWCHRLLAAGLPLRYAADAVVVTRPRRSVREILHRSMRLAGGRGDRARRAGNANVGWVASRLWRHRPRVSDFSTLVQADLPLTLKARVLTLSVLVRVATTVEYLRVLRGKPSKR
jgi:glycosyltransferase involved in cell wall biosynthesis